MLSFVSNKLVIHVAMLCPVVVSIPIDFCIEF